MMRQKKRTPIKKLNAGSRLSSEIVTCFSGLQQLDHVFERLAGAAIQVAAADKDHRYFRLPIKPRAQLSHSWSPPGKMCLAEIAA
jgi:hypothetical protein